MENNLTTALGSFVNNMQAMLDENYKGNVNAKVLSMTFGKKYVKIISKGKAENYGSVWAFIDMSNGDILKPAGWNAPAKHARGNIYTDDYMKHMTIYGPEYLR